MAPRLSLASCISPVPMYTSNHGCDWTTSCLSKKKTFMIKHFSFWTKKSAKTPSCNVLIRPDKCLNHQSCAWGKSVCFFRKRPWNIELRFACAVSRSFWSVVLSPGPSGSLFVFRARVTACVKSPVFSTVVSILVSSRFSRFAPTSQKHSGRWLGDRHPIFGWSSGTTSRITDQNKRRWIDTHYTRLPQNI